MKRYIVHLTDDERAELDDLFRGGRHSVLTHRRANILLKADVDGPAWIDARIAEAFSCRVQTVENVRKRFVLDGFDAALYRKRQNTPSRARALDGRAEAHLIATACSEAPDGRSHWTLQLLADKLVRLEIVDSVSVSTVHRTLKQTNFNHTALNTG